MQTNNNAEQPKRNISISGSGEVAGGEYGAISISGSGRGTGDIVCDSFKVSGSGRVDGNLTAAQCKTSGSSHIQGNLQSGQSMSVSGSQHIEGDVDAGEMKVSGSIHIGGDCRATSARVSGSLRVGKGMECEDLIVSGGIHIKDLLNVERLEIKLGGGGSCGEIGGEEVIVTNDQGGGVNLLNAIAKLFGAGRIHMLTVQTIEANRVELQNTRAEIIRGHDVIIGENCEIERVEYTGTLQVLDGGVVKENVKISE